MTKVGLFKAYVNVCEILVSDRKYVTYTGYRDEYIYFGFLQLHFVQIKYGKELIYYDIFVLHIRCKNTAYILKRISIVNTPLL